MTAEIPPLPDDPLGDDLDGLVERLRLRDRATALDRNPSFPWPEFRAMGEGRWLGLDRPTSEGGRGLPPVRAARLLYRLAYRAGTAFAKLSLQPGFSSVLGEHGSPSLREAYYRPLMEGAVLVGNHLTEPDAGSDLGRMAATAERRGGSYRLTGTKTEAAFAVDASAAIVYARRPGTSGLRGITAFLVPQEGSGIERGIVPDLGERWMRRGWVRYRDVEVPEDHRIGEEGEAIRYLAPELARERAYLAMIYLGVARASWEETALRAGERRVFDRPLAEHEAVGFPLMEDWGELEATRLYAEEALRALEAGRRAEVETSLAKVLAVRVALRTIDHAIQFHGGAGYSQALPHEQRYRDVRSGGIAHGSSEVLLRAAGRAVWRRSGEPSRGTQDRGSK
ncbi:MAG: acyl-CoA dehydrogenase family protein [Thermoplasmata archaeon]